MATSHIQYKCLIYMYKTDLTQMRNFFEPKDKR